MTFQKGIFAGHFADANALAGLRVGFLVDDDRVLALRTCMETFELIAQAGLVPAGIWVVPRSMAGYGNMQIIGWFLATFGLLAFVKFALFTILATTRRLASGLLPGGIPGFGALARLWGIPLHRAAGVRDPSLAATIAGERIDVLILLTGGIVGRDVLGAPRIGCINKHASVLPANRGLFTYMGAVLDGTPHGVSWHVVVPRVDAGPLLYQERVAEADATASMLAFQVFVMKRFAGQAVRAIAALVEGTRLAAPSDVRAGYLGVPTREDVRRFRRRGGVLARWRDVVLAWRP